MAALGLPVRKDVKLCLPTGNDVLAAEVDGSENVTHQMPMINEGL